VRSRRWSRAIHSVCVRYRTPLALSLLTACVIVSPVATQQLSAELTTAVLSVDLSRYVRVGRFDLPEPTRTNAPANSLLAQEASGVTYNWDTDTLFVVGDGGTSVVQITKTGILINSMTLAPGGSPQGTEFYDTEGIAYVGNGLFVLIEERYRQVNLFSYAAGGTLHRADVRTVKIGTTVGNTGLEGISYDPMTGGFILVKEKDPQSVFQTGIDFNAGTATNGSPSATSSTDLFNPPLGNLADFSDVFALSNLPSLSGQPDFSHLLIISQESGQIINVARSTGAVSSRLTIVADAGSPVGVPDMTMEGVTMDRDGNLYVVNENGGGDPSHPQLWVYAPSNAPNLPPVGVSLSNVLSAIPENTSTAAPIKLAEIVVTDDGLGNNALTVTGPDAASFQIIGAGLYLRAGTALSVANKPNYIATINVDDSTVGLSPDASVPYVLTVTASTGGTPSLIISEVAPWSSGNSPAALRVDWFEVTNVGTAAASIAGWKMDDSSASFGSAVAMNGIASIAPGESVIFMETTDATLAAKKAAFLTTWFGANAPPNLRFGNYNGAGVGLSTDPGDGVVLFNAAGVAQASISFGLSTPAAPFRTFDNAAGINGPVTTFSNTGINGAFVAATDPTEVGSPGTIGASAAPVVVISATDAGASEAGREPGTFRFERSGSTVGALTVNYTVATGAGQAGPADFTPALTGAATIAAGQSFVDLTITPVDDPLFEGPETVTLTVFDTGSYDVGTSTTATVTIADNDPPDTTIDSAPGTPTMSTAAHFTFNGSQPTSTLAGFECSLDGAAFATCTSPLTLTGLLEGTHTFAVRAVDRAGHKDPTPASWTWTVDHTPPVITLAAALPTLWPANDKMIADVIAGVIQDPIAGIDPSTITFRVVDEYGEIQPAGPLSLGANGTFAFTIELEARRLGGDRDGRTYTITVVAKDLAGNQGTASITVLVPHDQR
jgi:uncharacterized protein YjiK